MVKVRNMVETRIWTWSELAKQAHITEGTIYSLQAGRHNARLITIYKIANALGVKPSEIIQKGE